MQRIFLNLIIATALVTLMSCSHDHEHETETHEHEAISITLWSDSTELFMEYPQLVVGHDAKFLIHLSDMKNFKAVTEGTLQIDFVNENGNKLSVTEEKPARDGIYIPIINFKDAGNYKMTMNLNGKQVSDNIIVNNVIVYSLDNDIPHEEEQSTADIGFLKEQQWKIDFATEVVRLRDMQGSFKTSGEITAKPDYYSKVVSPVSGIVTPKINTSFPKPGMYVKQGELVITISPSADVNNSIEKIKSDFILAKSEYERVKKLYDVKAVAQKRLDETKFDFEAKQASYNALIDQIKFTENGYAIVAPISGYIENILINLGSQINSGQELFSIINPSRLILKVNVPASKFELANNTKDASFIVEGYKNELSISSLNGRKISVASSLDNKSRTLPVYFEFNNPKNFIKAGMYAEVFLKTNEKEKYLSIPISAIIDEDGLHTAYVQAEGESFQKRKLKTGLTDGGYIQVIEGLNEGERVVTIGGYQVRLAALSPESAIGHGHVH
ncbi:MAG: efflux RND transporter periplasmic adaptor subunit [Ignavibacteria bacterium]|nr:efflux RND transporter periplasmic adaptor subunit [Ignavibacteria bacterium]